jgi:hypothetical protein
MSEVIPKQPQKVHFEPGMHITSDSERDNISGGWYNGNPNSNDWNQAVTTRLAAYRPGMLAIDSLWTPRTDMNPENAGIRHKAYVLMRMPDRVARINNSDTLYAIAGDSRLGISEGQYEFSKSPFLENAGRLMSAGAALVAMRTLLRWIFPAVSHEGVHRESLESEDDLAEEDETQQDRQISRRRFIGSFSNLFFLGAVGYSHSMATYLPDGPIQDITANTYDLTSRLNVFRRLDRDSRAFVDGRTALMIEKLVYAMQMPQFDWIESGAVVAGNAHIPYADDLLTDESLRHEFIRDHVRFVKQYDTVTPASTIIDDEASFGIYRITEHNDKLFRENPEMETDRIVQFVGRFTVPKIAEIVKQELRP